MTAPGPARRRFGPAAEWTFIVLAAVGCWLYARANLSVDSTGMGLWNSDGASPVMLANDRNWDLYRLFYYGQDRFGTWPFFALHLLRARWTPETMSGALSFFLLAGVLPAAALGGRFRLAAATGYLVGVFAPSVRQIVFDLPQVYPWQLPSLFASWACLRWMWARPPAWGRWGLAMVAASLTTWLVPWSAEVLMVLGMVEGARAEGLTGPRRWAWAAAPGGVALAFEWSLRTLYHHVSSQRFGRPMQTLVRIDRGHLLESTRQSIRVLAGVEAAIPFAVVALVMALVAVRWFRAGLTSPRTLWTVAGAGAAAMMPLPLFVLFTHFRLNDYELRYFVPTMVLSIWGTGLLAAFLLERCAGTLGRVVPPVLALGALGLLLPTSARRPGFAAQREFALRLASTGASPLLLNSYWGTYVYEALAPTLRTLPLEGQSDRLPWREAELAHETTVLVGSRSPLPETPATWIFQYGVLLTLEHPGVLSSADENVSLYRRVPRREVPSTGTSREISIPPTLSPELYVAIGCEALPADTRAELVLEDGHIESARMEAGPRVVRVQRTGSGARVQGFRLLGQAWSRCGLGKAHVLETGPGT